MAKTILEQSETPSIDPNQKPLIVIASNRGPFAFTQLENGTFETKRGAGGLVTALAALAAKHEVLWIAAALSDSDRAWAQQHPEPVDVEGIYLRLLQPEPDAYNQYYNIIANPLLWFIQHQMWDIVRYPIIDRETWEAWRDGYVTLNRQFAETIAESVRGVDRPIFVFPQDYHLYMVPRYLRDLLGDGVQIQPFVHIPWPGPDAWRILPGAMRAALLDSLLASDRIGFQTQKDAFNFVQTARFLLPDAHSYGSRDSIEYKGKKVFANTYPISIDVKKVETIMETTETQLHKSQLLNFLGDRQIILRVDRIEPSKNILRSLQAYRALLEEYPEHHGKVQMLALLVPSRMEVIEYRDYLQEIMAEAGMINAEYSDGLWEPVRIIVGNNYNRAIAAMQLYDVLLVNPVADGMNLVAKEGVLVNQRDGALVLSEYAGAFYELGEHALVISPFDIYSAAEAIHYALEMPREERARRAEALRQQVRGAGVRRWFADQVEDAWRAFSSQVRNASTSSTPTPNTSAESRKPGGASGESTPNPTA